MDDDKKFYDGSHDSNEALRLSLYITLKNLYDKWLSTYDRERFALRSPDVEDELLKKKLSGNEDVIYDNNYSEFSNFIYVDSFYNDISEKMLLNPESMLNIIRDHRDAKMNFSVYDTLYALCQKNKLLFITLPIYNNYYDSESIKQIFMPDSKRTMSISDGATYICMYTHQASHVLNNSSDKSERYRQDGFDIADVTGDVTPECSKLFSLNRDGKNIMVPAFGVTYARQNQSFFKNITVNMDSPKLTDYSIMNQFRIAKMGSFGADKATIEPKTIAQDAYSIFANQSYTCTVEMLGCMNIMPMMYFQLNNMPMFRGAYMITSVEHRIEPGNAITKFIGTRVSKIQKPYTNSAFALSPMMTQFGGKGLEIREEIVGTKPIHEIEWNKEKEIYRENYNGKPMYRYFDTSSATSDLTKIEMPSCKDNEPYINVYSKKPLNKRVYKIGEGERGFFNQAIVSWMLKGFRDPIIKKNIDLCTLLSVDSKYNPLLNLDKFGFAVVGTYTVEEANSLADLENNGLEAFDIASMIIQSRSNENVIMTYSCIWDGKGNWVSDHVQGKSVFDVSDYRVVNNNINRGGININLPVVIYRFSDIKYEKCEYRTEIMKIEESKKNEK